MLDDGGHFNDQQIITTLCAIPNIKDGGLLAVEDVHTSYMASFNSPSKYSFINFAKSTADRINARFPDLLVSKNDLSKSIYSTSFYESIVAFKIDRSKCFDPTPVNNQGITSKAKDFRKIDQKSQRNFLSLMIYKLLTKIAHKAHFCSISSRFIGQPLNNLVNRKLKRLF